MRGWLNIMLVVGVLGVLGVGVVLWLLLEPFTGVRGARVSADPQQPARLAAMVRVLSERFFPRDHTHVANLDAAARYIAGELRAVGVTVTEQEWQVGGQTYRNLIARIGGDGPERIVVGAHYDACGADNPGADDNASGVAGLIALAQQLTQHPPALPVELVAWSLEEPPYFRTTNMGSAVHARSLAAAGVHVRAMLSLEMIGYFSDTEGSQSFPVALLELFYPTRGNYISIVGKLGHGGLIRRIKAAMRGATPLPVHSIAAPRFIPGIDFSDHLNYWDQGWPAVMITDTAFYRNNRYHTPSDTADTLDYQRMSQVVDGVTAAVHAIAD